ncbi:Ger(x)C family spore germination protein [Paenibacillus koleovorans]|uniref:Ger(x)C family spore germination protein n=1 Tax=Paenibacillus koleovorans TaxID=121608 RepID=UPI000FDB97BC|nr:Ger(x)C family spore germination protein [Paenibacillus koleovorans]
MKPRMVRCIVLLLAMTVVAGCWDVRDINKRYLPVVMGVNRTEAGLYKVILQVPNFAGGTLFLDAESQSISKAVDIIRTKAEKSVDLSHLRLFLLSKKIAHEGFKEFIDYAIRVNNISIKGMVAIVDGDFEKTLHHKIQPTPEVSSYDYFSEEGGWTPNVSINRLWEAFRGVYSHTEDFSIPLLEAGTTTLFVFKGSAIIRRDRMVGALSPNETLVNNIFQEKYTGGTIEIAKDVSVLIKKAKVNKDADWTDTGPILTSKIKLDVVIMENKKEKPNEEVANDIKSLLEERTKQISEKLRSLQADILGNGQSFRPFMSSQQMRDWKDIWYPQMKHEVQVTVNVLNNIDYKEKVKTNALLSH